MNAMRNYKSYWVFYGATTADARWVEVRVYCSCETAASPCAVCR